MKKLNWCFTLLILICGSIFSKASDIKINFSNVNINEARKQASVEGKLLFVGFHASWCNPCKWMDQTTFKDESVTKSLNENYVALKIDIDNADGYELKRTFDVKYLPTMLIFNSQGQLLDRIEETLSPRKLMGLLDKYNAPENKIILKHDFNTSPTDIISQVKDKNSDSMNSTANEFKKHFTDRQQNPGYRVQVGVFERYEGAKDMVNTLRQLFIEPVTVINEYKENKPVFKVRIGQFSTPEEAENFKKILYNEYNMSGIVL